VDEEEGRVMVMNRKVEEAKVLRILQRRLAQVAEERQVPPEIPRVPDLNQPTLLLAKVRAVIILTQTLL
jgi:ABC-type branched-subunit amino acid transport system ATPase component